MSKHRIKKEPTGPGELREKEEKIKFKFLLQTVIGGIAVNLWNNTQISTKSITSCETTINTADEL
jgi:hypothetical protein